MFMVQHYFNNWQKGNFRFAMAHWHLPRLTVEPVPDQEDITYDLYKSMKYSNMFFQEYQKLCHVAFQASTLQMLLGILTASSCCLFTISCPLVCLVSAQLWQAVSYTTEGTVEFLLSVLEWAEGHSVTPKCNPKCVCVCVCTHVHVCVGGSDVSTLEGTSLLVWVTCHGVNVSASQFRWCISEVCLHVPLSLSRGMEPSCLSSSAHGHTHSVLSSLSLLSDSLHSSPFPRVSFRGHILKLWIALT